MCRIHFPFYLNVVGYKLKNLDIALFIAYNKFYLNVVGYKPFPSSLVSYTSFSMFYLNVVGYKQRKVLDRQANIRQVLSERSGI